MRRLLSTTALLVSSLVIVSGSALMTAAPVGAATASACTTGQTVHVTATFAPNPVHRGADDTSTVTFTNCTATSQSITFKVKVTAPSSCGGGFMAFGPIPKTLTPHQVSAVKQVFPAPSCPGVYTMLVTVFKAGKQITQTTGKFTVT